MIIERENNLKSLALVSRGLDYLNCRKPIPLPLRIQLESIQGVSLKGEYKASLENLAMVKKVLLTLGLSYIVGYIIGLLFGKAGGGSSGGGGGGSTGYTLSQKDKLRKAVIDTYGKSHGNAYTLKEVFTVVSKSKSSDLPEHIRNDIIQIARGCSGNHEMGIDEALAYILKHNSDLDKLRAELMINHHNRSMSALYYHSEGHGIKLLTALLSSIKNDIGRTIDVYNTVAKNYYEVITYYHGLIGKAEMFNVEASTNKLPDSTLLSFDTFLRKLNMSSVKNKLMWGDITASKNQLFSLLQTESNTKLTETEIQNLFKNSSVRFIQIVDEHAEIAQEIDNVGETISRHHGELKKHEELLKQGHLLFDEIKGYITKPNELGIAHSNDNETDNGSISRTSHRNINPLDTLTPLHVMVKNMESDVEVVIQVFARMASGHEAFFRHLSSMDTKGKALMSHIDNVSSWLK